MWTVEGNRAHDFQRIPNVCTLCGLSLAPEIIPSSWYYTLYLSGFFRVGSALSLGRRSCGRKYTCASGRAHREKSTSYTWKCWQGPHRCTLNLDSRLCVSSKAAATSRNTGCAILGSHHNQLYLLLILPCDAFFQVNPCCPAPNACPHIPTLRWKSASLLYPCWRHVLEDLF